MTNAQSHRFAFPALLVGSTALALGPWMVRLADVGPVAAGFWRLALALPFLFFVARAVRQPVHWPGPALAGVIAIGALFFAADLAAWHASIGMTKLANATLFGNTSSFVFAAWGLWHARRWPSRVQGAALVLAAVGAGLLMGSSAELSARNLRGDLLALFAGVLYTGYLIAVQRARGRLDALPLLFLASLFGAAFLLPLSLGLGEQLMPRNWTPLLLLVLSSQVLGQGLLVYAVGHLSPLVVGLTLLSQPAIAALVGWLAYRETISPLDWVGAAAIAAALVLVRLPERGLRDAGGQPS